MSYLYKISVKGARVHNLKNIDVEIPRDKLVVFTGISGSGKSSLAFDTIYAEGQRRFMETLSPYARQFIGDLEKPDVDKIDGLSPSISIEQKSISHNPRSTVGTVTEIYDFLRLLFARCGTQYSPDTGLEVTSQTLDQIFDSVMRMKENSKINILSPVVRGRKGHYKELFENISYEGFNKVRVDGKLMNIKPGLKLTRYKIHDIDILIDRVVISSSSRMRIYDSLETGLRYGNGVVIVNDGRKDILFNEKLSDPITGRSFSELSPNTFSFNSPYGWCPKCLGYGVKKSVEKELVFPDKNLSYKDGGIAPLGKPKKSWIHLVVKAVLNHFNLSDDIPIKDYPEEVINSLLYGIEESPILVKLEGTAGEYLYKYNYQGLVHYIEKQFNETSSSRVKEWAESFMSINICDKCNGGRLKEDALWVKIENKNISEITSLSIVECKKFFDKLKFKGKKSIVAEQIIKEIKSRLNFLINVGLGYLTLNRNAQSLSGGEAQRIRLATQMGSQLTGVVYILDEPSIGLHQRDNIRLINSLKQLRDLGNSIIVVEHDREMMESSDYLVDLGPGAGDGGGRIVVAGEPKNISCNSITIEYLKGIKKIDYRKNRRIGNGEYIILKGAKGNNLKNITLKIPLGKFICVTGVSGSGKSTLINDTLYKILKKELYNSIEQPLPYESININHKSSKDKKLIDKVIEIDQQPIGRTPRSNPATYTGLFTNIRDIFANLPESRIRGYKVGRFSFNVKGGRCESCEGGGLKRIEMNFLPDVYVTCDVCKGKRYNSETLQIKYKDKSIADILDMTVEEATELFKPFPSLYRKLKTLYDVGLGYIRLGQQATTLSGGEAQRVKLATELSKVQTGKTLYLLDEPTTGLHFEDIKMLLNVLNKLVDKGNTVIIIEHNLDVIKNADWIIDLGPEGGDEGGYIIAEGTPEELVKNYSGISYTAQYLKNYLD
ncbi:MAG: excinuclease ABC subunit UvrA [Ignavibacteria bacterium]|nr:excinuclease ABC subunit UvrA [Ignavibacteria bacterium]